MALTRKVFISRADLPLSALNLLKNCELDVWDSQEKVPRDIFLQKIRDKEALLISSGDRIDNVALDAAPYLRVIATLSSGLDHIDVEEVKRRDIKLGYTRGILEEAVAELAIGLLISGLRRFVEGRNHIMQGTWPNLPRWDWMNGSMIKGSVVGIVGFGSIGAEVAARIVAFKPAKILYFSRKSSKEADKIGAVWSSVDDICKASDIIIVTLALNRETQNLFDKDKFALMKENAFIVNVSRGNIFDQEALIKAVSDGKIAGAALDVMTPEPIPMDHELIFMKKITLLPHIGSADIGTRIRMAEISAENIIAGLDGRKLPSEV